MPKNCLVTGGAGFIGSHLVDKLIELGHNVSVIDNLSATGSDQYVHKDAFFVRMNILDPLVENIIQTKKIDTIFHLAAIPRVQQSIKEPEFTHKTNVEGTFNLLSLAKKYNVERFIFASSSAICGNAFCGFGEQAKPDPLSPYALQKLIGEQYCQLFLNLYGLKTISLRIFNAYGPRQNPNGEYACVIPKFISLLKAHKNCEIFGDGNNSRDYIYISDIVNAFVTAGFTDNVGIFSYFGQVINVGSGKSFSVNEITEKLKKLLNVEIENNYLPAVIESRTTKAEIKRMETLLGIKPKIDFDEGLKRTIEAI
jgi:UDP-glucose 4-epimerase